MTRATVIAIIEQRHPSTLASLKRCLEEEHVKVSDEELVSLVKQLQYDEVLKPYFQEKTGSFEEYLLDFWRSWWIYLAIVIAISESTIVFSGTQIPFLLSLRMLFGIAILGFIPGYLTVRILFPRGQLNSLEQVALSVFLSVLISVGIGILLGAGLFFQPAINTILLSLYVFIATLLAAYRSYNLLRQEH